MSSLLAVDCAEAAANTGCVCATSADDADAAIDAVAVAAGAAVAADACIKLCGEVCASAGDVVIINGVGIPAGAADGIMN
jgi:hypothetical protein